MQSSSKPKLIFIPAAHFEFHNKLILQLHFESKDLNFKLRSDLLLLNSVQLGLVMDLPKTFNAPMLYTFYLNVSSKLSQAYYILLCFTLKWLFSTILCVLKLDIAPGSTAQVKLPSIFILFPSWLTPNNFNSAGSNEKWSTWNRTQDLSVDSAN